MLFRKYILFTKINPASRSCESLAQFTMRLALISPIHDQFVFSEKADTIELHYSEDLITVLRNDYRFSYLYPVYSSSGANILRNWPMKNDILGEEQECSSTSKITKLIPRKI